MTKDVVEHEAPHLFIGGEWSAPHSGRAIASIDPSTEKVWAHVAEADETDVDRAVGAARVALRGPWTTNVTASQRGALLLKLAEKHAVREVRTVRPVAAVGERILHALFARGDQPRRRIGVG